MHDDEAGQLLVSANLSRPSSNHFLISTTHTRPTSEDNRQNTE